MTCFQRFYLMNILINCSNLKKGGGLQVADSICCYLNMFPSHHFTVVLSSYMDNTAERIKFYDNIKVVRYDISNAIKTIAFGRDSMLDSLVIEESIDCVLTIFGPSRWSSHCAHLCGFARAHILLLDSPYFKKMNHFRKLIHLLQNSLLKYLFKRGTTAFWTENAYITHKLQKTFKSIKSYTISNYYNQVFDEPQLQVYHKLPDFDGVSILSVNAPYPHKNLNIAISVADFLFRKYPTFRFRFVFTVNTTEMPPIPEYLKSNFCLIDKVDVSECPSLYRQCQIMFQPTLLECFTATYPEAMKMGLPILTTDLPFAKGLCENAAVYYSPLDAQDCALKLYKIAVDEPFRASLLKEGQSQLSKFYDSKERANKIIDIIEKIAVR